MPIRRKRSNGEGTYWRQKDGTWIHQITIGRKPDGSPFRKAFTGKTRTICTEKRIAWVKKYTAELAAEAVKQKSEAAQLFPDAAPDTLFSVAFLTWLRLYKSPPARKPSTYASYIDTYDTHFEEVFGNLPLNQITQDLVQGYYQKKQCNGARKDGKSGGLSAKTIRNQHMILKSFFDYAVQKYKLPENPAIGTTRPEVPSKEMRVLSHDEMHIFIKEVLAETQRVAILTDLFVGMRVGELLALEIDDFNPNRKTLAITKNLIRVKTEAISLDTPNIKIINYSPDKKTHLIVQNTPKTKSSYREVSIPDDLCELLTRHIQTLARTNRPNPNKLLFPSTTGTYLDPKSFELRLKAVSRRCEIQKVNPHALRHTLATRLVEEKTPLNIVKEILGHASITTTQKYLHGNEELEREAIGTMSNYVTIDGYTVTPQVATTKNPSIPVPSLSNKDARPGKSA